MSNNTQTVVVIAVLLLLLVVVALCFAISFLGHFSDFVSFDSLSLELITYHFYLRYACSLFVGCSAFATNQIQCVANCICYCYCIHIYIFFYVYIYLSICIKPKFFCLLRFFRFVSFCIVFFSLFFRWFCLPSSFATASLMSNFVHEKHTINWIKSRWKGRKQKERKKKGDNEFQWTCKSERSVYVSVEFFFNFNSSHSSYT